MATQTKTQLAIQTIDEKGTVWNSDMIETEHTPEMMFQAANPSGRDYTYRVFDAAGTLLLEVSHRPHGWIVTGGIEFVLRPYQGIAPKI